MKKHTLLYLGKNKIELNYSKFVHFAKTVDEFEDDRKKEKTTAEKKAEFKKQQSQQDLVVPRTGTNKRVKSVMTSEMADKADARRRAVKSPWEDNPMERPKSRKEMEAYIMQLEGDNKELLDDLEGSGEVLDAANIVNKELQADLNDSEQKNQAMGDQNTALGFSIEAKQAEVDEVQATNKKLQKNNDELEAKVEKLQSTIESNKSSTAEGMKQIKKAIDEQDEMKEELDKVLEEHDPNQEK